KLENQLKMFATTFGALAEIFTTAEAPVDITPKSASYIIDVVTQSVCEDCSLSLYCWKNKQFEAYEGIHRLVGAAERNGDISEEETTIWFKDSCVRLKRIMEETKVRTREFKTNLVWQHRLFQNRSILKEQLICAENIISSLGTTVLAEPIFYESLEKEIRERLKKLGVDISKIYVANDGLFEISITKPQCFQNNQCLKTLLPVINATTGCRFVISSKCKVDRHGNCIVVFNETKGFRVKTGFASSTKFGSNVSGDTYILDTICNKGILALCDGMGSGKAAAQESQRVSQLIKKFLYAGLDLTLAVKVLNSALAVSSENDMYTTLDICSIDLITGETEIIKNGGATVFVYDGEKVNTIRSQSLPVGVIDHWTGEKTDLQL
ncbi:MAG: SpoIIE family protein phosphatase, partial [Anaerotignaceae bacterium]